MVKKERGKVDGEQVINEMKKKTIKDYLKEWSDNLTGQGKTAFWPSWAYGTYIKEDNRVALANRARLAERKLPPEGTRLKLKHGKFIKVKYVRKPKYFLEDNALQAIANCLLSVGDRRTRRALCRKLQLKWSEYKEGEAIIMEQKSWTGYKMDAIAANHGVSK